MLLPNGFFSASQSSIKTLTNKEKRKILKEARRAFKESTSEGLGYVLDKLKLVSAFNPKFAKKLRDSAEKTTRKAVEKALKYSEAEEYKERLESVIASRSLVKKLSDKFATELDKTTVSLIRQAVAKAYKKSYAKGAALVKVILEPLTKLDRVYAAELKKTATETILPPLLDTAYKKYALERLDKIIADAQFLQQEIERLRQQEIERLRQQEIERLGQQEIEGEEQKELNPLEQEHLKTLLSFFDKWFGVVDDKLDDEPEKQLERLATLLSKVEEQGEELRAIATGSKYPMYDVSKAVKLLGWDQKAEKIFTQSRLTSSEKIGHTTSATKDSHKIYLDANGKPLYPIRALPEMMSGWIAFTANFKKLGGGTPQQPSPEQLGAIVHEWVHADNRVWKRNINRDFGGTGGHIEIRSLDISRPKKNLPPEYALYNSSTWGAAIAGKVFEIT